MKQRVSQRRQPLVRTAIYSLMTLIVVVIVGLLMLVVLGYSFNKHDGRLEQGGLLQFESAPQGADVTLDEEKLGSQTNTRSTVDVGSHTVSYDKSGYRTWSKTITIKAAQIGWLSYARLIPTTIAPSTVHTYPTLTGSLASPQHNYMLLHEAADQPSFVLANIQGDTVNYSTLTLPSSDYTTPTTDKPESFTLDSWSNDEQAVLIKHTYDDTKTEWILLNRNSPDKSVDINTAYGISPSTVRFAGNGNRLLFVQTDDTVRRINLDEQTLSRPIATKVDNFTVYDEKTIAYATTPSDKNLRTVAYAAIDQTDSYTLGTYPADAQPLYIAMATYFSTRYVTIVHGPDMMLLSGTLPSSGNGGSLKQIAKQTIPANSLGVEMSHNSRFAVVRLTDGYATYDIELMKYDKTTWATQPATPTDLHWLDDFMLWSDAGGKLRFYEFDGANQQDIMPVTEGFSASISPNDKYIYGVDKTDKGYELRRARLEL